MYGQDPIAAVCPSKTRRTTHDRACKAFCKGWKHFLDVLGICYNERKLILFLEKDKIPCP